MSASQIILSVLFFISLTNGTKASFITPEKIYCSHPQVCNLARSILSPNTQNTKFILAYKPHGDIHESTPTASEMKALAGSEYLIVGPSELHFWSKKLLELRKNQKGSTITLEIKKELFPKYQKYSRNSLAHFWLYPELTLELQKDLATEFANRFALQANEEPQSVKFYNETLSNLNSKFAGLKGSLVIITHDALLPLLSGSGAQVFSLKSSEHGEISPNILKRLEENLGKTRPEKTLWILEKNISHSTQINKLIKTEHKIININTEGSVDSDLEFPLKDLLQKIGALN